MTQWIFLAGVLALAAYLVGSVPFGYVVARLKGIDIRQHGSKNIGATNVARVLGRKWGYLVFALDVLKGAVPVAMAGVWLHPGGQPAGGPDPVVLLLLWLLVACAAIAGHIFPVWLRFRGGKGVATSLGVVLAIYPFFTFPGLIALGVWVVVVLIWRYVSLASIAAAVAFPAALLAMSLIGGQWGMSHIWPLVIFGCAMPLLVVWRHRTNIARLIAGTESKIGRRSSQSAAK